MFKHKPCNAKMILKHQDFLCGEYPQTHTCPKCGAYIFIDNRGLQQCFSPPDKQTSYFDEEFEIIPNTTKGEAK